MQKKENEKEELFNVSVFLIVLLLLLSKSGCLSPIIVVVLVWLGLVVVGMSLGSRAMDWLW